MNKEIIDKLDEIETLIKSDKELIEYKELEKEISNNHELLDSIKRLKEIDKYDKDYLELKEKILSNEKFKRYKDLEKDLYFFIKEINKILNSFNNKGGCR